MSAGLQERGDQHIKKRRNHDAGFKDRVALEVLKGEHTVSELASEHGVHPTMIHQCSEVLCAIGSRTMASTLFDGAADIFERGGKRAPEIDEEKVRSLHAKIRELVVANDFSCRKLKP